MSDFREMHLEAALAAALERLGHTPADDLLRELLPTVARGHNIVALAPPAAVYAVPAVAAALSASHGSDATPRLLVLAAASALEEWRAALGALAPGTGLRIQASHGPSRAARRLRDRSLDILVVTPETALDLVRRSALKMDALPGLLLAWPETWDDAEQIAPLMQDLPGDAQRIIYTGKPDTSWTLVERYARKALTLGLPAPDQEPMPPAGPVRIVTAAWGDRARVLASVIETLDPSNPVVWTAWPDPRAGAVPHGEVVLTGGEAPDGDLVIALDLPDATRLRQLLASGPVVLLVPPHGRDWVARIAAPVSPLRLPDAAGAASARAAERRAAIRRTVEEGGLDGAHLALGPLLDRYDPADVAAALYQLWTEAQGRPVAPALERAPAPAADTARIWVGVGRKDGATPNDLVGALTREVGVDRGKIGKVDIRELYTLVEVPAGEAETIARNLMGRTIRRRRVTARLDRGATPRR